MKRQHSRKTIPAVLTVAALLLFGPGFIPATIYDVSSENVPGGVLHAETPDKADVIYFRGNARDLESGKFLYSENHAEFRSNGKHTHSIVTYRDADGKAFARKRITFTKSTSQPDFRMEDFRDGYVEGATLLGDSRFQFFKRSKKGAELEKGVVKIASPGVIDGGFDYFIRENFDSLAAGQAQTVNFGVSARFTYFSFVISKTGDLKRQGRDAVRFKLAPQNFILRQLIEPLYITYDRESRRLLEYTGYTNIDDGTQNGRNFEARIVFSYPEK
ncbi:MAG: hypothetical protein RIF32_06690 [Leptospirales bacterium]|jgi:hypothetical protein